MLAQCEFALNSNVSSATGKSPFEIVFGVAPRMPLDIATASLQTNKNASVEELVTQRQHISDLVKSHLQKQKQRMKTQADKKRRSIDFGVNDLVWLKTDHLQLPEGLTRKLATKFCGPFLITAQVSDTSFRLDLPGKFSRLHPVFHASQLKLHHGPPRTGQEPAFIVDGEAEYEVANILKHRTTRRGLELLVEWKNYDLADATWEPEGNLTNCQ